MWIPLAFSSHPVQSLKTPLCQPQLEREHPSLRQCATSHRPSWSGTNVAKQLWPQVVQLTSCGTFCLTKDCLKHRLLHIQGGPQLYQRPHVGASFGAIQSRNPLIVGCWFQISPNQKSYLSQIVWHLTTCQQITPIALLVVGNKYPDTEG